MMRDSAAALERWFFYQDVANLWKWARIDVFGTVLSYSGASFATRDECLEDARLNGYREDRAPERTPAPRASGRQRFHGSPRPRF